MASSYNPAILLISFSLVIPILFIIKSSPRILFKDINSQDCSFKNLIELLSSKNSAGVIIKALSSDLQKLFNFKIQLCSRLF